MYNKIKILFVSPSVSRLFTGVYEVQKNLALEFIKKKNPIEIHGLIDDFTNQDLKSWLPIKPFLYKPFGFNKIGYNPNFLKNLNKSNADIGHIHSLWSYTTYALYIWSKKNNKPYLLSVNAYLFDSALRQSKILKNLALYLGIRKVIKHASCIHVNTKNEYEAVRALGYTNPVSIIPNGVQLPNLNINYPISPWYKNSNAKNKKILLYLSRIHSQKGIQLLVDSWKELSDSMFLNDWHLVIVGFQKEKSLFENNIIDMVTKYNLNNSITMLSGQFDESMKACYSNCSGFILPSFNEGTSIAALNALAFSKPTLITKGCNITNAIDNGAAICIETNTESIKKGILTLIKMTDSQREILGHKGRLLVEENYTWESVSDQILEIYSWLKNERISPMPKSLIID
jgi:poly(glycerol-phosphate) alpha-glucosyltransferase